MRRNAVHLLILLKLLLEFLAIPLGFFKVVTVGAVNVVIRLFLRLQL